MSRLRSQLPTLAVAIFVALLCSVPSALAVDPGVIVFQGFRTGGDGYGVFTMSPDGSNVKKIGVGQQPSITRDGKKLVFVKGGEIFTMEVDGSNVKQVTDDKLDNSEPVLSPDGKTIVFSAFRPGKAEFPQLYTVNADGTNERALTGGFAVDTQPAFSPDGKRIVFVRGPGDSKLVTMPAGGGDVTYLTGNFPFSTPDSPSYSPNGKRILFHGIGHNGKDPGNYIYSFDAADGSDLDVITKGGNEGTEPAYSPDGSSIVYRRNINLYSMDADGDRVKQLTTLSGNDGGNTGPHWGR